MKLTTGTAFVLGLAVGTGGTYILLSRVFARAQGQGRVKVVPDPMDPARPKGAAL